MIRAAVLASGLLHAAVIVVLLTEPPKRPAEPDELPGMEVVLGALLAPGDTAAAATPPSQEPALAPAEEPPELRPETPPLLAEVAEIAATTAQPAEAPPTLAPVEELPAVADLPIPPHLPPVAGPPAPRQAVAAAQRPPPAPQRADQPVVRPLFRDSLAEALSDAPGTRTEGKLIPVREVPGIRNPMPIYPEAARQRGQHGAVGVRLRVDADGSVLRVEVVESSGYPLLDQAVVDALRRWRFAPATEGGKPVAADFLHRTIFRLD